MLQIFKIEIPKSKFYFYYILIAENIYGYMYYNINILMNTAEKNVGRNCVLTVFEPCVINMNIERS